MLGMMKMNIKDCIDSYTAFMKVVFPTKGYFSGAFQGLKSTFSGAKWDDKPLVKVIRDLVGKQLGDPDILLLNEATMKNPCKVSVQTLLLHLLFQD